jgi:polyribonucleotide nucleotidyltransferase
MVECGADEIPDEVMVQALELGHKSIQPLIELQLQMAKEVGKTKREVELFLPSEEIKKKVFDRVSGPMNELLDKPLSKNEFYTGMAEIKTAAETELTVVPEDANAADYISVNMFREAFELAEQAVVRERILTLGKRPDGRTPTQVRPIWCEVNVSPRAHGTGLFTRGETQILSFATLGTLGEAQELDNLSPNDTKRYMHHYNFPPFSTG